MMKRYGIRNYCILLFVMIVTPSLGLTIVKDGESSYTIVSQGSLSQAETLQKYIHKSTSVFLPIKSEVISNQNTIYLKMNESLDAEEIHFFVDNANLVIQGGSDIALQNAVWVFLENYLNCKWLAPGVEVVPTISIFEIDDKLNYSYKPKISTRTVHSRLFYDNPFFAQKLRVTTQAFPKYVPTARVHTFHRFIPEEVFYEEHPEFYALRGDKRLPTQLCLTNATVLQMVKDSVAAYFERYPEASVISVSQDDNQQYCTCENCTRIDKEEGSHAGTMIQFVNEVAAAFPNKTISTLAYQYTRKAPKSRALDNVLITLCSIECDRSGPIEEKCVDFANDLKEWKTKAQNVRIWDYTTQFTNFLAPFPNLYTLQPNLQLFVENNAKWVFEQHSNHPSELFELRSYLMAKLLWNPQANVQGLIEEFTNDYYHEAGSFVREYIEIIHEELSKDPSYFLFLYGDPSQAFDSFLNPSLLAKYDDLFNKAQKAVEYDKVLLKRVQEARLSVDFTILEACRKNVSTEYSLVNSVNGQKQLNNSVTSRLSRFVNTCSKANITLMNEMGFTVEEYQQSYLKSIEVASKPNKALGKKVTLLEKPKKYANEDAQVLTDGALGGNSFYANWLGFEGNNLEAVIDLGTLQSVESISMAFLQVTNHVVFFPLKVEYAVSRDGSTFKSIASISNNAPLTKKSKVNNIQYFNTSFKSEKARFIKVKAYNMGQPPYWHHAAGTKAWIFADEIIVD